MKPSSILQCLPNYYSYHSIKLHEKHDILSKLKTTDDQKDFSFLSKNTSELSIAIDKQDWSAIATTIDDLFNKILGPPDAATIYQITHAKRQLRETYVSVGGLDILMLLIRPKNGKRYSSIKIEKYVNTWNQTMVILREVVYSIPALAATYFSKEHMHYLFGMLSVDCIFDGCINLLEEILALKTEALDITEIPNVYDMFKNFGTRKLAVLTRVLSLLLFEPEDRIAMEEAHNLGNLDLLRLRRDRMTKQSSAVERNQHFVLTCPFFLPRILTIIQITNNAPGMAQLHGRTVSNSLLSFAAEHIKFNLGELDCVAPELFNRTGQPHSEARVDSSQIQHAVNSQFAPISPSNSASKTKCKNEWEYFVQLIDLVNKYEDRQRIILAHALSQQKAEKLKMSKEENGATHTRTDASTMDWSCGSAVAMANNKSVSVPTARRTIKINSNSSGSSSSTLSHLSYSADNTILNVATAGERCDVEISEFMTKVIKTLTSKRNRLISRTISSNPDLNTTTAAPTHTQDQNQDTEDDEGEQQDGVWGAMQVFRLADDIGINVFHARANPSTKHNMSTHPIDFNQDCVEEWDAACGLFHVLYNNSGCSHTCNSLHNVNITSINSALLHQPIITEAQYIRYKKILMFQGLFLVAYQIEVLFVLCTLLTSRRKLDVQNKLHDYGLDIILRNAHARVAWNRVPDGTDEGNMIENETHMETAFRIQYLRLIHNYFDRDFMFNSLKFGLISPFEYKQLYLTNSTNNCIGGCINTYYSTHAMNYLLPGNAGKQIMPNVLPNKHQWGQLTKLSQILIQSPTITGVRFWLSSSIEAFLRGAKPIEQLFVAKNGLLSHLVSHILTVTDKTVQEHSNSHDTLEDLLDSEDEVDGCQNTSNLQSTFDLLSEIIKFNPYTLQLLENLLDQLAATTHSTMNINNVDRFFDTLLNNLLESNVFIRSLYMTMDYIDYLNANTVNRGGIGVSPVSPSESENESDPMDHVDLGVHNIYKYKKKGPTQKLTTSADCKRDGYVDMTWFDFTPKCNNEITQLRNELLVVEPTQMVLKPKPKTKTKTNDSGSINSKLYKSIHESMQRVLNSLNGHVPSESDISDTTDDATVDECNNDIPNPDTVCALSNMDLNTKSHTEHKMLNINIPFDISDEITYKKLFDFLNVNKVQIIIRLLTLVTVYTVNHENLCCLNTVITILLIQDKNCGVDDVGGVPALLNSIRCTIDKDNRVELIDGQVFPASFFFMKNFRELLWYWGEYYMRRGRDRLSLEFSTHIPCIHWKKLISLLCGDNRAHNPYALLYSPIPLPLSPYVLYPNYNSHHEWCKDNPVAMHIPHSPAEEKLNADHITSSYF